MKIPDELQAAIESEIQKLPIQQLAKGREGLTDQYRQHRPNKQAFITNEAERLAYLAARMPATYAAIDGVLEEVKSYVNSLTPSSLLDLGAGPGTFLWAASKHFQSINVYTMIEQDPQLIDLGKRLFKSNERANSVQTTWMINDLEIPSQLPQHDLVTLSYSIGELSPSSMLNLMSSAWNATKKILIIVEPGTPIGFERIRLIRKHLILLGGHMVAPCPHQNDCPMSKGNWCHFSARVERSFIHRRLKSGSMGYEDEKFSYLVFSKEACELPWARVLTPPLKRSGHVVLSLCVKEGLEEKTISKRTPELYKEAKKADWGSKFDLEPTKKSSEEG